MKTTFLIITIVILIIALVFVAGLAYRANALLKYAVRRERAKCSLALRKTLKRIDLSEKGTKEFYKILGFEMDEMAPNELNAEIIRVAYEEGAYDNRIKTN